MNSVYKKVVFLFPGQGSQNVGMASSLYNDWPWFKKGIDELFALSPQNAIVPLNEVMLGLNGNGDLLMETLYTQPILYALEVMLAQTWGRWGLKPSAVIGHSLGDISAAAVAGACTFEDGMRLASERGRLMQELLIPGKYTVVLGESSDVIEIVHPYKPDVTIGGSNGPNITVVSGLEKSVDKVLNECTKRGMNYRLVNASLPFHSPLMKPMIDDFEQSCKKLTFQQPSLPWFSTMSGQRLGTVDTIDIEYWKAQIIEPVRFWVAMASVTEDEPCIFLEIGSGRTLINMGKQAIAPEDHLWLASLDPKKNNFETLEKVAVSLSDAGILLNIEKFYSDIKSIKGSDGLKQS